MDLNLTDRITTAMNPPLIKGEADEHHKLVMVAQGLSLALSELDRLDISLNSERVNLIVAKSLCVGLLDDLKSMVEHYEDMLH